MKNKVGILIIIIYLMVCMIPLTSHAVAAASSVESALTGGTEYDITNTDTISVTIHLGKFTNVEEGKPLGYTGTVEFDSSLFSSISIEGKNGWNAQLNEENNKIVGDTVEAKSNSDIATLNLKINKDNIDSEKNTVIKIKELTFSDGDFEESQNKEISIKLTNNKDNNEEEGNNDENENSGQVDKEEEKDDTQKIEDIEKVNGKEPIKDNTGKQIKELPKAGIETKIIIAISILVVLMIIFKIKSRKIKY